MAACRARVRPLAEQRRLARGHSLSERCGSDLRWDSLRVDAVGLLMRSPAAPTRKQEAPATCGRVSPIYAMESIWLGRNASTASSRQCQGAGRTRLSYTNSTGPSAKRTSDIARERVYHPVNHRVPTLTHVPAVLELARILREMLRADVNVRPADARLSLNRRVLHL